MRKPGKAEICTGPSCVYLLHYSRPLSEAPETHPRRHYIGTTTHLDQRVDLHRRGQAGATFTTVAAIRGIGFELARTWSGGRDLERLLKRQKNARRFCPLCHLTTATSRRRGLPASLEDPVMQKKNSHESVLRVDRIELGAEGGAGLVLDLDADGMPSLLLRGTSGTPRLHVGLTLVDGVEVPGVVLMDESGNPVLAVEVEGAQLRVLRASAAVDSAAELDCLDEV